MLKEAKLYQIDEKVLKMLPEPKFKGQIDNNLCRISTQLN